MLTSQNFFTTWCTFTKNHLKHRFDNIERAYMNQRNCFAPACPSSLTNNSECIGTFYHLVHNESPETQCFDNLVRVREGQEVCLPPTPKTPTPKTSHFQVFQLLHDEQCIKKMNPMIFSPCEIQQSNKHFSVNSLKKWNYGCSFAD